MTCKTDPVLLMDTDDFCCRPCLQQSSHLQSPAVYELKTSIPCLQHCRLGTVTFGGTSRPCLQQLLAPALPAAGSSPAAYPPVWRPVG